MPQYTVQHRVLFVKTHYNNGENFSVTLRKLRSIFGLHEAPFRNAIVNLIIKVETEGIVVDQKSIERAHRARADDNIAVMLESVRQQPAISNRHHAEQLGLSYGSLRRISTKDLHLHAYIIQITQEL